jgi:hypothetical protein
VSERGIQAFYDGFFAALETAGIPVVILGGQAMLRYHLAETTKDADLFVRPAGFRSFLELLAVTRYEDTAPVYRVAMSAPLAEPWAGAGWSSHFEFPIDRGPRPRIDVLARPPRIDPGALPRSGLAPLFLLAETKKTRREAKDWGQVATLGHFLLDTGDVRGLLLLQDADELQERLAELHPSDELIAQRPALRLALARSDQLGAAIETERRFWRFFDACRLERFEQARRPYTLAVRAREEALPLDLLGQHDALCAIARELLIEDPVAEPGIESLVDEARRRALLGYPGEFESYLPPKAIVVQPWKK